MTASAPRTVAIWRSCLLPGSETFIRDQGGALTGWRPAYLGAVKVASPIAADTDAIAFPDTAAGRAGWLLLRLTGRSARLRRLLAGLRPEVVHAHFAGDGWLVSRAAGQLGLPLVVTLHGLDVTSQARRPGLRGARHRRHLRTVFARAALIIAVSDFIRDRAVELGADPAKVRVHHTGVPIAGVPAAVPPRWDVVFVGRFVAKKGLDDLVEAIAITGEPRPRVLLIGAGPLDGEIRRRAAELGLDATFLGAQDATVVRRSLAEAKVFVAPSKTAPDGDTEGLPTTILEAGSMGLPTVSTYHSGIPEAVVHGETGLLCAEGDRPALAAAIRQVLSDDELGARLGRQARRHVETHFDLDEQTARLEQLYEAVCARPAAPARSGAART
ncbi:glycosyltransferase [Actinoplanes auranticolor]|uniref:Glycosyl transferase family 1 n=1 Tax=Actinoplanes auranticolor TaxID=47988 RepID=A0A919S4T0_9ACTN|nr:glycosyltransferase [Actinoplanes auranticolor]GIM63963.1 glycosyl transferase family 1 [Actinoplanes auranticolor]